ncbi:methylmalonate-semialdehyde dehydrogenase (acylating), partial [Klebsiella pneumoniae]
PPAWRSISIRPPAPTASECRPSAPPKTTRL